MVTADERSQGARLSGDTSAESARSAEARRFGRASAELNQLLRLRADGLAAALEDEKELRTAFAVAVEKVPSHLNLARDLPPAFAVLKAIGFDTRRVEKSLEGAVDEGVNVTLVANSNPVWALALALRDAGRASQEFGDQYLRDQQREPPEALTYGPPAAHSSCRRSDVPGSPVLVTGAVADRALDDAGSPTSWADLGRQPASAQHRTEGRIWINGRGRVVEAPNNPTGSGGSIPARWAMGSALAAFTHPFPGRRG